MSSTGTAIPHLTQQRLSPKDKAIMEGLEDWLSSAEFEPITNICTDKRLSEKWALLREMDLAKKFTHPVYQIIRVPLGPSKIFNPKGPPNAKAPTSMTPMRILEGNPTVSGQDTKGKKVVLSLATGWTTYITEQVEASPALDILFITSQPEDGATVYSSGVSSVSSGAM